MLTNFFCRETSYSLSDADSARAKVLACAASGPMQFVEVTGAEMAAIRDATKRGEMWALCGREENVSDLSPEYFQQMAHRFRGRGETMTASWVEAVALHVACLERSLNEKCEKINDLQELVTSMVREK